MNVLLKLLMGIKNMRVVENLKSMILTALIISSLVLTGSLWFDNYQGLSFAISKIPDLFLNDIDQEEYSKIYEEIILPYKVTVINPDENKWIAYSSDKMNQDAWNILKNRISNLSSDTEIISIPPKHHFSSSTIDLATSAFSART